MRSRTATRPARSLCHRAVRRLLPPLSPRVALPLLSVSLLAAGGASWARNAGPLEGGRASIISSHPGFIPASVSGSMAGSFSGPKLALKPVTAPGKATPGKAGAGAPVTGDSAIEPPITLSDPDGQDLVLEDLTVKAAVDGMLSLTELELRFRNPQNKRIEGRFSATLPPGATISRFAKEVNGQLMEGEVVERLKANRVYDQILQEMRDPALLEQDQGNRFSAKVFPIEASSTVRLVLSYSRLLPLEDGVRTFSLPLRGLPTMGRFSFHGLFSALPGETSDDLTHGSKLEGPSGAKTSTVQALDINENSYTPPGDLNIRWKPSSSAPRVQVLKAGDFYLTSFRAPVAAADRSEAARPWVFYVDTSASSADGSEHRISALEDLLGALPPDASVEVLAFDQKIAPLLKGAAGKVAKEIGPALRARVFLGGTDLEAVIQAVAAQAAKQPDARFVLATDGVATLGKSERKDLVTAIAKVPAKTVVEALVLGSREDEENLQALTAGRGRIVAVPFTESLAKSAREAAARLAMPVGPTLHMADSSAEWVYPDTASDVQAGSEVIAVGRLKAAGKPGTRLEQDGKVLLQADTVQALPLGTFEPLLEREGYRAYLAYLAQRESTEPNEGVRKALADEQVKVSVEHRVMIPRTTLLVLESEADYQRFGLDRRALASILTVGATGIERLDRSGPAVAVTRPEPEPVLKQPAVKQPPVNQPRPVTKAPTDGESRSNRRDSSRAPAEAKKAAPPSATASMLSEAKPADLPMKDMDDSKELAVEAPKLEVETMEEASELPSEEESGEGAGGSALGAGSVTMMGSGSGSGSASGAAMAPRRSVSLGVLSTRSVSAGSAPGAAAPPPAPRQEQASRARGNAQAATAAEPDGDWEGQAVTDREPLPEWVRPEVPSQADIDQLSAAIKANPRERNGYNHLSDALAARNDWKRLRQVALDWQAYDPDNPQVYESLGEADLHLGLNDETARAFASLIEVAPGKTELLQRAGLLLLRAHEAQLAESPLRRALELRPDRVNGYRSLALILWQQGRLEEAAHVLEDATKVTFPGYYGNVQRVVVEELAYVYRAWLKAEPNRAAEIRERAGKHHADLARTDALRVTLAWETDANDVDLHVVDPSGEECYYSHKNNASGLELYEDITRGLGPEVVRTSSLAGGTYYVGVNYFSAGPMGVSRGLLVVMQPDAKGDVPPVQILPFRLIEGGRDMRLLAKLEIAGPAKKGKKAVTR